ncbi:hypothetical protein BB560_000459 [Smittium megazygosporum]|uniref:alpha,alpha-trehalose-phosphate synthase (UDP-forming) n=2 Tax=Smittium megazygosporum TaxID=133381 RepID=A0A2T9ZKA5_9FUNG|nr:hypothetical protein BB560_000459 [Smittium megazygosporum]
MPPMTEVEKKPGKLIVISNRLPITLTKDCDSWSVKLSSGGLVTALSGLKKEYPFTWVGWPGQDFSSTEKTKISNLLMENSCVPVFLDDKIADLHYNGFSNSVLWPLFHYHPAEMNFEDRAWEAYKAANEAFAKVVLSIAEEGDLIWIHDYHLMLLAQILQKGFKSKRKNIKIGWFLHTPFPSSEIFRILPVRQEILEGVLAADLIGFHTLEYSRHFISSCTRVLGLQSGSESVEYEGRNVRIGTFPIGIDPTTFIEAQKTPAVSDRIKDFKSRFKNKKIIVGVDRLDYIKGVPQKFLAYENLLKKHPEYIGNVVLVQVAVPSRGDVEEYQELMVNVNELVGLINGKYATIEYTPIHFLYKSVDFTELVSIYTTADVCLITSTRDGMNLVSYEYIACQNENNGVLVLSEFTGAASSLNGSLIVNPWDIDQVSESLHNALSMDTKSKARNYRMLSKYVNKHTAAYWGVSYVKALNKTNGSMYSVYKTQKLDPRYVQHEFMSAQGIRTIFISYDGTLCKTQDIPELAVPKEEEISMIKSLSLLPNTLLYISSGRSRDELVSWFGDLNVGLISEHGCFFRHPPNLNLRRKHLNSNGNLKEPSKFITHALQYGHPIEIDNGWFKLLNGNKASWKETVLPLLQHYTERTPGSLITMKEVTITWHYRLADPEFGLFQANELQNDLEKVLAHLPLSVSMGNRALEIKPSLCTVVTAVKNILANLFQSDSKVDFIMIGGSSKQDELLFNYLNNDTSVAQIDHQISFTVGKKQTEAEFFVPDVKSVMKILESMACTPAAD